MLAPTYTTAKLQPETGLHILHEALIRLNAQRWAGDMP